MDAGKPKKTCPRCGKQYRPQGFAAHVKSCSVLQGENSDIEIEGTQHGESEIGFRIPKLRYGADKLVEDTAEETAEDARSYTMPRLTSQASINQVKNEYQPPRLTLHKKGHAKQKTSIISRKPLGEVDPKSSTRTKLSLPPEPSPRVPNKDDFRTTYHPNAMRDPDEKAFDQFQSRRLPQTPSYNDKPWLPFHSESEFDFAELVLDAALSNKNVDALIKLIHTFIEKGESFGVRSHKDLEARWKSAAGLVGLAEFKPQKITVDYFDKPQTFEFYSRDLWDWAVNVLEDEYLGSLCEWDALKFEKFDGQVWVPFVSEPWSGRRMWDFQDILQRQGAKDGKPLCITLYADKTRLSSFGTAKGYPIMARIDNLPKDIRNGRGLGSVQVVGWLPIVEGTESEKRKVEFADFKRAIWHQSFRVLLHKIAIYSKTGCTMKCGDGIERVIYPFVFILVADYEEQTVMTLTRGATSLFPCPICLVPRGQQSDLSKDYPMRSAMETRRIVEESMSLNVTEGEKLLKSYGLRPVMNAFWDVNFSDPHQAVTFDEMHVNDHGLGGKHLWPLAKKMLDFLGDNDAKQTIENRITALPKWPNLTRFKYILSLQFSDANKFRDLMKLIIFVTHDILTASRSPLGYITLQCIRAYLEMVMWESLEVHTANTIISGKRAVLRFSKIFRELDQKLIDAGIQENFEFPKAHAHKHVFDHILDKGAIHHHTTRIFEGLHPALKKWYQRRTSFKDVAPQILMNEFNTTVSLIIRHSIDIRNDISDDLDDHSDEEKINLQEQTQSFGNIYLGSVQKRSTFHEVEHKSHPNDDAFKKFHTRFAKSLNEMLLHNDSPVKLQDGSKVSVDAGDYLKEYRFIKSSYESLVDWRAQTDYLRCSPLFHKAPRYDCVLIHNPPHNFFARLLFVFVYTVKAEHNIILPGQNNGKIDIPIALVQPFTHITPLQQSDKDLGLIRLQEKPRSQAIFIPARSICRGAYIVPEGSKKSTWLVVDVLDTDMFLRLQLMFPHMDRG